MANVNDIHVLPSLLAADHSRLAEEVSLLLPLGITWLHFDVMDGHFVPNINFGPRTLQCLNKAAPDFSYDVHLMLDQPQKYIEAYADSGAARITVHIEPDYDHLAALQQIMDFGCLAGIALNPATPVESVLPFLDIVDLVLPMTVQPGFGGQSFHQDVLEKISQLKRIRSEKSLAYRIQVDGGIDSETGLECRKAGADTFVTGTAFFKADDRKAFIQKLVI